MDFLFPQIHVRAGDDEWNVYRRYAQFFALCLDLKKKYPAISKFIFPPKKTLRKKVPIILQC